MNEEDTSGVVDDPKIVLGQSEVVVLVGHQPSEMCFIMLRLNNLSPLSQFVTVEVSQQVISR